MFKNFTITLTVLLLAACSSTPDAVTYHTEDTPLQQKSSTYNIRNLSVELETKAMDASKAESNFRSQEQMLELFSRELKQSFHEFELPPKQGSPADAYIDIHIHYRRNVNLGEGALSRPIYSYSLTVFDQDNTKLVTITESNLTLSGGLKNNIKVLAWQWDSEDEKNIDVPAIAIKISEIVSYLGT